MAADNVRLIDAQTIQNAGTPGCFRTASIEEGPKQQGYSMYLAFRHAGHETGSLTRGFKMNFLWTAQFK
ncbi:hypothetical protein CCGE525_25140 (plasmid) [Rhizobium jaguaris]|uniref:Uncharacterized protein n=1 Tax=Rhizobium jaguaris TaxID=1312183 RepID=A0A387FS82_9HYPH|nr:hypothetical protein CCGE525_25140 [Rhizobium jaguaris]